MRPETMVRPSRTRKFNLEDWLEEKGFTPESDDPAKDGTVMIRALRHRPGLLVRYPERYYLVPDDDREEYYQADRIRGLLGLDENEKLVLRPTAGFYPRGGRKYRVRLRLRESPRGDYILVFPARRSELKKDWQPQLLAPNWNLEFQEGTNGAWLSHHLETGQLILSWQLQLKADETGTVKFNTQGYTLKPRLTDGFWIIGKPKNVETLSEGQELNVYEPELARRVIMSTIKSAPDFPVLGGQNFSAWEIFATPKPTSIAKPEQLLMNFSTWARESDVWMRRELWRIIHPDNWPAEMTKGLSAHHLGILQDMVGETFAQTELALDWATMIVQQIERRLRNVIRTGLPISASDFSLPMPAVQAVDRKTKVRQTQTRRMRRRPLRDMEPDEIRGLMLARIGIRPGEAEPESKRAAMTAPAPSTTKRKRQAASVTKHVRPSEVVAYSDSQNDPVEGLTPVQLAMRGAGIVQTEDEQTPVKLSKKGPTFYFGLCSVCGEGQVKTNDAKLRGEVVPGKLCNGCAKRAKKGRSKRARQPKAEAEEE